MLHSIQSKVISYVLAITATPMQFGVWVIAAWFTSNGPLGYLTCTSILTDPMASCTTYLSPTSIPVTVNACHLACHVLTGVIGLVAVRRHSWTKAYALVGFLYYVVWGIVGLVGGEHLRHHLGVDAFGCWVHVVEGIALLLVWLIWRSAPMSPRRTLEPSAHNSATKTRS